MEKRVISSQSFIVIIVVLNNLFHSDEWFRLSTPSFNNMLVKQNFTLCLFFWQGLSTSPSNQNMSLVFWLLTIYTDVES